MFSNMYSDWLAAMLLPNQNPCEEMEKLASQYITMQSWTYFNTKMSSYQYRNFHYKVKSVSWQFYRYNGKTNTSKDCLYIEKGQV